MDISFAALILTNMSLHKSPKVRKCSMIGVQALLSTQPAQDAKDEESDIPNKSDVALASRQTLQLCSL